MNMLRKGPQTSAKAATQLQVSEEEAGQRIDNFLIRILKGVPKSHVYRLLRTGQVRVNSRRTDATYRLQADDRVRVPPVRTALPAATARPTTAAPPVLSARVLLEDEALLVLDKPSGVAAHGGSGISAGAIERMRAERPQLRFLELVIGWIGKPQVCSSSRRSAARWFVCTPRFAPARCANGTWSW